jgi:signal peptidase I
LNLRVKKGMKYAEYAGFTVLIGLTVYIVANLAFGVQTIYVVSDYPSSMSPTINYGDLVLTFPTSFTSLHVGDIIFFHDPRGNPGVIVHRIVSVTSCGGMMCVQTKGDNQATNPTPDPYKVTANDYLSQVVLVIPAIGYLSPALWGFRGLTVLIPFSFIVLVGFFVAYGRRFVSVGEVEKVESPVD